MSKERNDEDLLRKMRANFLLAEESESDVRADALDCWRFRAGEQWDESVLRVRKEGGRPCYVINRVPQFIKQVSNEQKQNRPAIQIDPLGDGADKETGEIVQGIARHVELVSDGEQAYDLAFDHMLTGGFGYFRMRTDYVSSRSWDQDILLDPIFNPFSVYLDPLARRKDRRDMRWAFVIDEMSREAYEEAYPDSDYAGADNFASIGDRSGWILRDTLRVAEYYWIESEKKTLCKLSDGTICFEDEMPQSSKSALSVTPAQVIARREVAANVIHWIKTNGYEVLDETTIPGDYIPIIPVLGEEFSIEGRRYLVGIVQWLREPSKLYNLWQSAMAETIALAPKAPFMATPKQMQGFEDIYDQANNETYSYLPYNPDPQAPGPPQRQFSEPPIQAITSAIAHADNDMKTTTGLYDPSLGAPGPEQSGRAILLRQKQGDQANFNFLDSMHVAIRHAGRIMLGWIKSVYDTARVVRIVRPDGSQDTVPINQWFRDGAMAKLYDLTVGEYDIAIQTGPSYQSRREEAAQSMLSLIQSSPQLMQICGDLLLKNFDWPYADEISERLKKMLPPQLQDGPDGQQPLPPQVQQKIAAQGQMIQQLTQALHQLAAKQEAKNAELASRERIALVQAKAGLIEAMVKANSAEALAVFQADLDQIDRQLSLMPDPGMVAQQSPLGAMQTVDGSTPVSTPGSAPQQPGLPVPPAPQATPPGGGISAGVMPAPLPQAA